MNFEQYFEGNYSEYDTDYFKEEMQECWEAAQMESKKELTAGEKACIAVYMSIHVSQIDRMRTSVRNAWEEGQKLYEENKQQLFKL